MSCRYAAYLLFKVEQSEGNLADHQGVEGSLIKYAEGYDPLDETQRLQGAKWRVDPSLGK